MARLLLFALLLLPLAVFDVATPQIRANGGKNAADEVSSASKTSAVRRHQEAEERLEATESGNGPAVGKNCRGATCPFRAGENSLKKATEHVVDLEGAEGVAEDRPNSAPLRKLPTAVCRARYSYHPSKADWEGARQICQMEGGQLAVITNERSQGRIGSRFGKLPEFWIGATDIEREGQFRWVNGQGLGFARWYRSQPSKSYPNNEHCVTFNYWGKDTKWGDRNCFDSRPFLCETMVCRPTKPYFPGGYPGSFKGPLKNPYNFPRNKNYPGPQGLNGIAVRNYARGRGFPYNQFQHIQSPIHIGGGR